MNLSIYKLMDPITSEVRYVGITKHQIEERLKGHIKMARRGKPFPVCRWIRLLMKQNLKPLIELIEENSSPDRESYFIREYRNEKCRLLNCSNGGRGLLEATPETRMKLADAIRQRWSEPIFREKFMRNRSPMPFTSVTRQKLSAAGSGRKHTPETIMKMCKPKTPLHIENAKKAHQYILAQGRGKSCGDRNGSRKHPERIIRGSQQPNSKLTESEVVQMRRMHDSGISTVKLAKYFNMSQGVTWKIVKCLAWKHVPAGIRTI